MKSTRFLLLCGALAVVFSSLSGCALVTKSMELGKSFTAKLTGADDPNNTSALAKMGRLQNDLTDQAAGAVGMKSADATPPVALATETAPTVAVKETVPVAVTPAPAPAIKKAPAKKVVTKPSSVKTVADTTKVPPSSK